MYIDMFRYLRICADIEVFSFAQSRVTAYGSKINRMVTLTAPFPDTFDDT